MASLSHSFVKLLVAALIIANATMYGVGVLARRQVMSNAISQHNKVYLAYLQTVERMRKGEVTGAKSPDTGVSPYWLALRELRKQFPYFKLNIEFQASAVGERDRKVMEVLKSHARGSSLSDQAGGWARSFYVLPTKNVAALRVTSLVRDDLNAWETTAKMIGGGIFMLLLAFGWLSSRKPKYEAEIQQRIQGIKAIMSELDAVMMELVSAMEKLPGQDAVKALDEMASQIRMLAVNGSIEAARSADTYRIFHVMMQEINQLATHSRELIKTFDVAGVQRQVAQIEEILRAKSAVPAAAVSEAFGDVSVRRAR